MMGSSPTTPLDTFHFDNVNDELIVVSRSRLSSEVVAAQLRIIARPADMWQYSFRSEDLLPMAGREKRLLAHALQVEGSRAGVTRKSDCRPGSPLPVQEFVKELDAVIAIPTMAANLTYQRALDEIQLLISCSSDLRKHITYSRCKPLDRQVWPP